MLDVYSAEEQDALAGEMVAADCTGQGTCQAPVTYKWIGDYINLRDQVRAMNGEGS